MTAKTVMVVHPQSRMRVLLRSVLQDHGRTVVTDHSCRDVLADRSDLAPAAILLDRSFLDPDEADVAALLRGKWPAAELVVLPLGIDQADTWRDAMIQLLRHLDGLPTLQTA